MHFGVFVISRLPVDLVATEKGLTSEDFRQS